MKKLLPLFFLLTIGTFIACEKDYYQPAPVVNLAIPVSFASDILPIFKANCYGSGCHNTGTAPDLSAANAYDNLTQGGYVDSTNAEGCILYKKLTATSKPMPPNGKLSADVTNKVLAWIKQGTRNN